MKRGGRRAKKKKKRRRRRKKKKKRRRKKKKKTETNGKRPGNGIFAQRKMGEHDWRRQCLLLW